MNAITPIRAAAPVRFDETEVERAHRRAISIHCPNQDEMTMAARVDLATMRDLASSGAFRAGDEASRLLLIAARVATNAVYAPLPFAKLQGIRAALHMTIEAARAMERALRE